MNRHEAKSQFRKAKRLASETAGDISGKKPPDHKGRKEDSRGGIQRQYGDMQDGARNGS